MQRKKEHIDSRIEEANTDKGIIVLLTGNGKGKSSSSLGMVCRALGYDMKVGIVKFLKGVQDTGEDAFLAKQPNVQTAFSYKYLDEKMIIDSLNNRPKDQHVVITGRAASDALIDIADTVSEVKDIKHAFRANIKAQKGVDL